MTAPADAASDGVPRRSYEGTPNGANGQSRLTAQAPDRLR